MLGVLFCVCTRPYVARVRVHVSYVHTCGGGRCGMLSQSRFGCTDSSVATVSSRNGPREQAPPVCVHDATVTTGEETEVLLSKTQVVWFRYLYRLTFLSGKSRSERTERVLPSFRPRT